MSSNVPAPTADDNLIAKGPQVKSNIALIKEKKQKILTTLQGLSKMENPDKEMMGKLVAAFDSISAQEHEYMEILTNIAEIHGKATEDVAIEIKEIIEKKGKGAASNATNEKKEEEQSEEDINKEISSTLREISEMQTAALAASMVNEQLVAKLSLSKSKHLAMKQARDDVTAVQSETARVVLEEREKAMKEVMIEKQAMEKKKKELEKLRKTVVKKECEGEEEGPEIEMDESERIPPLRSKEEERKQKQADEERQKTLEERRAEIRARVDAERKRKDGVNQQIREKLAAMDKRKERMSEIRRILSGISQQQEDTKKEGEEVKEEVKEPKRELTEEEKEKMDEMEAERTRKEIELNLAAASMSLKHLTEMREKLEAIQALGEEPTMEEEEIFRRLDLVEKMGDETA